MAVGPGEDEDGPLWTASCDTPGCVEYYPPRGAVRNVKELRPLARRAGWRMPTSAKNRAKGKPDLCPAHTAAARRVISVPPPC